MLDAVIAFRAPRRDAILVADADRVDHVLTRQPRIADRAHEHAPLLPRRQFFDDRAGILQIGGRSGVVIGCPRMARTGAKQRDEREDDYRFHLSFSGDVP